MAVKNATAKPGQLSEEYVQDSDESDTPDDEAEPQNGLEAREVESQTEAMEADGGTKGSDDEDESEKETVLNSPEKAGAPSSQSIRKASSASDDDDDVSNGSDSDVSTSSRKRSRSPQTPAKEAPPSRKQRKQAPPICVPTEPFNPPPNFEPLILDASDYVSVASEAFSDLSGKQVWHISAPASVNLMTITQLDISAALSGGSIVTSNGFRYGMQPADNGDELLLLPEGAKAGYRASGTKISRSFRLKAIEKPVSKGMRDGSDLSDETRSPAKEKLVFTAQDAGQPKTVRQQPEGLRTRYTPFGVLNSVAPSREVDPAPIANGSGTEGSLSSKVNRTPTKASVVNPVDLSDAMDVDDPSSTSKQPELSSETSPAKSATTETPREKKKKKRSRLVDTPRL